MNASVSRETPLTRISIVMPSLNHGAFIEHAIRSVLDQDYPALELIVVDGGSSDGTRDVLQRHQSRLAYSVSQPDAGPAAALQHGFARATGDVLGVLNADDFLLPGSLEAIARAFQARPDADVISGHGYFTGPDGEPGVPAFSDRWDAIRFRYGACVLLQPATFCRRAAFERAGGFRATGRVCWDMELWADLARCGAVFADVDARVAAFRLHPGSITARADQRQRRRRDARAVAAAMNGGADTLADAALHYWYRARKFAEHPARTLRQRWYFYSTLGRWSL